MYLLPSEMIFNFHFKNLITILMFYAEVFKDFFICFPVFDNVYCFLGYIHFFFLFVLDSFLCRIRKYGEERPYVHM